MVEIRRLATAYPKRKVGGEACRVAPDRLIQGARFDAVQTGETRRQDHPLAAQRDDHTFDRCEPPAQRARAHQGCWEGRVNAKSTKPIAGVAPATTDVSPDVLVIGAGAIGASAALHLARAGVRVTLLEKESGPAQHQSGRNSGVIHAGYNLKPGSLKAKYCVEGSRALRQYCRERGIAMEQGGILIVARTEAERATLLELHRRAQGNGVQSRIVDADEVRAIEPHARGIAGLHAPEGASFDATAYVRALLAEGEQLGVELHYGMRVRSWTEGPDVELDTTGGRFSAPVLLNCAGLHADRVAGTVARDLRIVPFRGYYAELRPERITLVRSHVYAAPDLTFPFLGVHLSRRVDGRVIVGPGAMLAFGREAYSFARVQPRDLVGMLAWPGFWRMILQPRFRALVRSEVMKSPFPKRTWAEARLLIPELTAGVFFRSFAGPPRSTLFPYTTLFRLAWSAGSSPNVASSSRG